MTRATSEEDIIASATAAEARQDRIGFEGAWALMRERFPDNVLGYLKAGIYLRDIGSFAEADEIFERGMERVAEPRPLMIHHAWSAFYRLDWNLSLTRWTAITEQLPDDVSGYVGCALSLMRVGNLDEAERTLDAAPAALAEDIDVGIVRAQIADARHDWRTAIGLWAALKARTPLHEKVLKGYGNALQQLNLLALDESNAGQPTTVPERQEIEAVEDKAAHDLLIRFESFGDNCEFGLVQRRFGAEPIGLLRWTDVPAESLARMLEARFTGLGEVETSEIMLIAWGEYFIMDRAYGLGFHTWVNEHEGDPSDIFAKHGRRIRRLRDELVEILDEGRQMVVYKPRRTLTEEMRQRIFRALRAFGRNTLLLLSVADDANAAGTVRELEPGLVVGYLTNLSPVTSNARQIWDIPFEEWLSLCRQTLHYHETISAAAPVGVLQPIRFG